MIVLHQLYVALVIFFSKFDNFLYVSVFFFKVEKIVCIVYKSSVYSTNIILQSKPAYPFCRLGKFFDEVVPEYETSTGLEMHNVQNCYFIVLP